MQVTVLKPLDYGHNGVTVKHHEPGEDIHVRDELVPGLTEAGFVGPLGSKPPKAAPAAPAAAAEPPPAPPKKGTLAAEPPAPAPPATPPAA